MITNSNQIELRHLRYFQALAHQLHFRRAAESLYISQPGLSRQIQQLETFLDCPLFIRDKKHVELTAAGTYFQKEVDFILNQVTNACHQATMISSGRKGGIKIGFVGSAMQDIIPELIIKTTKIHPDISFSFEEMRNPLQVKMLSQGEIDLGFVRLNEVPENLEIKAIHEDTFSVVLPPDHSISSQNFKDMRQFKDDPFILFQPRYSPAYYKEVLSICEDAGYSPNIAHNSVHASTIYRLVENGLGISIIPTSLQKGYDMKVKFVELTKIRQKAKLSIVYSKKNRNPSLPLILDIIQAKLNK